MLETKITLPAFVDIHVHLRDDGQEPQETYATGTRAMAKAGGVFAGDMPNKLHLVKTLDDIKRLRDLAAPQIVCDVALHLGTLGEEDQNIAECIPYVYAMKAYFEETTGHYVIRSREDRRRAVKKWETDKPLMFHAVGASLFEAFEFCEEFDRTACACHLATALDLDTVRRFKDRRPDRVFAEATPHHLAFDSWRSPDFYMQMKPPLGEISDRLALWKALRDGTISYIGTDHAPHTDESKMKGNCFGVTCLEGMFPFLLMAERAGWITLDEIVKLTSENVTKIYGLPKYPIEETFVEIIRHDTPYVFREEDMESKAGKSPFNGVRFLDEVDRVALRGQDIVRGGKVIAKPGYGLTLPQAA